MASASQGLDSRFPPARIFVQIKHRSDSSISGQTARPRPWVIAAAEAFYVSQFWPQWKSTCFYKSSPLRNTCTEQQAHCFPLSYVVKIERRARQHQAGLLNHSSFLAPLGWLKSSCQKHFIMTDMGLEIQLVSITLLLHMETTIWTQIDRQVINYNFLTAQLIIYDFFIKWIFGFRSSFFFWTDDRIKDDISSERSPCSPLLFFY